MSNEKVKSVYFGLFQTLGDVIVSTAIIRTIKEKYKNAEITYAVGADYLPVLKGNPDISKIIACGHPFEVVLRSKEQKYDKVFLPLMLTQEDTLWHQRYPWCSEDGENHNLVDMYAKKCQDDIEITDRRTFVYPTDQDWNEILESAQDKREDFEKTPFITIHTTSRNPSKDWNFDRFVQLSRQIHEKYGINIYQIGGNEDNALPQPVKDLRGMPLNHTMALLKRSKLHIDIDSGPSFIADSLNVPTVCIMGATWANTSGPIGPNVTFIEPNRHCLDKIHTPCHTRCLVAPQCIDSLEVSEVFNVIDEKLGGVLNEEKEATVS